MERRRGEQSRSTELPSDYLKMICEVFTSNFDAGLKALAELVESPPRFEARGRVYADEVVLCVSVVEDGQLAATSVYGSADFDPKASAPTVQDLLASLVDGIGAVFAQILIPEDSERMQQLASHSLSAMDNVPFHWSEVKVERQRIHLKVDKSNPKLDALADDWLEKNDPEKREKTDSEEEEAKKLFVTGPKAGSRGSVH